MEDFKLISSTKASDVIPVEKYVSLKTGLTVIIAKVDGPVVNGYFCLATEAHDDDGLPHTLEHLIFLGSERYPYKGILDLLANRCMAHGTNAWTDIDHTCYTINTVGAEGMLSLLPIYLDHILHPTLTEEGFVTEVHHIDGEGEDAGVVYCEMQGRENDADSRCELTLLRSMYPNSGYSSDTGGIMANLRTSTDNIKVRDFHKKFYRPENLTVILTGQIEAEDVFKALADVEADVTAKKASQQRETWIKPWQTVPPPPNYSEIKVHWPADTEDCGQVLFGWRGPSLSEPDALKDLSACAILLRYLCDTATAPLQRRLVEREDALAADVSYNITENQASYLKIQLDNVPMEKLVSARDEALACLSELRAESEPIDTERMRRLVRKQLRESMFSLESGPHTAVAFQCIGDALYSRNEEDFVNRLNPQILLRALLTESSEYWLNLLRKHFTTDQIIIMGSPSVDLQASMAEEERNRIEAQREQLGEQGLAKKIKILQEAMEFNERPPPPGTLSRVPVPSCDNLKTHSISSWATDAENCPHFDLKEIPLYARVHSINTNFVYIHLIMDLTELDEETRKWLPIIVASWGECPVWREGVLVPHEQVVADTETLAVLFTNEIGFNGSGQFAVGESGNTASIEVRCEPADYEAMVKLLWEVLYSVEITKERLLVFAQRMINDVSAVRRNGNKMVHDTLRDSLYKKNSNVHWCSVLRQQQFLKRLVERLSAGGDCCDNVLREAKSALTRVCSAPWLHLVTDFKRHTLSTKPWSQFGQENEIVPTPPKLYWDAELIEESTDCKSSGFAVGVGGIESNFLLRLCPGPLGFEPTDTAPLLVALNYFTQLEGPMWRLIRGAGLSYGYGIRERPHEGRLSFSLYKSTNVLAAYQKAQTILEEYLSGGTFDEDLFASAKSTALFEVVERIECPADVVHQSLINYLRKQGEHYTKDYVKTIACVTPQSAGEAAARWLPALFDPALGKMAIVCHPSKVQDTASAFNKIGIKLETYESLEVSHFNQ